MPGDLKDTIGDEYVHQLPDTDPVETQEWIDSLDAVADTQGATRARFLVAKLIERAHEKRLGIPGAVTTPYVNTIPLEEQPEFPGDPDIERRIRRFVRWNAAVMVVKANHR
ncbi:MAG: pyruvate dehydrogenase (acetyl-transferring), homodimeric type, partial [Actinobacteria bacterium]|nr:pyruvate dehydrogenase (acetyl-transferring), homodimeric type [Actinomycetota bacterium]